jgi:predicted permease
MWRDARIGLRRLFKRPGSSLVAVLTLGLGIGASASTLSIVNAVLLRPLPFRNPARLVRVYSVNHAAKGEIWPVSYPDFLDWRSRSRSFVSLAAFTNELLLEVPGREGPELLSAEMVSASYFQLLGVKPVLGRTFLPSEDTTPGGNNVVLLGYEWWRQRFHGDRTILGKSFELNQVSYVVIGVLPRGFQGMSDKAQVWLPISMAVVLPHQQHALDERKSRWLSVIGRLRAGLPVAIAHREMATLTARLAQTYPDTNDQLGALVEPLASAWYGKVRPLLLLLLGGSSLVLLIVFGNLSNLWLAEGIARKPEISLRAALGAEPRWLIREILTESLLLTLAGTALGLWLSMLGTRMLARNGLALRSSVHIGTDLFVVGTVLGLALALGTLFGTVPALLVTRAGLGEVSGSSLQRATAGQGRRWLQSLLIIYEVAFAMILLIGAGAMTADFQRRSRQDLGFPADHLLTLRTMLQGRDYASDERVHSTILSALGRLGSLPGVSSVAFAGPDIPTDPWHAFQVTLENRPDLETRGGPLILRHHVSPGYFQTFGVPVMAGREFSPGDRKGMTPVVLVSYKMSRRFWPGESPLGKRLKLGARDSKRPWLTVVGVVGDIKYEGRDAEERPGPDLYLPILQSVPRTPPILNLVVRSSVPPEKLAPVISREFRRAAPGLPLYDVKTMEERLGEQVADLRLLTFLMIGSAMMALVLAVIGVYGIISCVVGQRIRELGIRLALGATSKELLHLLVGYGLRLTMIGVASGIVIALGLNQWAQSYFHDSMPLSTPLVAAMSISMVSLVCMACYLPAQRALKSKSVVLLLRGLWGADH